MLTWKLLHILRMEVRRGKYKDPKFTVLAMSVDHLFPPKIGMHLLTLLLLLLLHWAAPLLLTSKTLISSFRCFLISSFTIHKDKVSTVCYCILKTRNAFPFGPWIDP